MTQTVLNGGSKTAQDLYTGPPRELTVDDSNQDLRLHDGSTPGGTIFQSRDNADARYQPKSDELEGLMGFEPQEKGWLVRLGPADYRLRTITVNGQNLTITNGTGFADNPRIELASTIESDHIWNGQHIFNDVVQFNAGINADVSGDTQGTHTGDVVGNVEGNLTGDSTGTHTGPQVGDVDVRGKVIHFDDGQIPFGKLSGVPASVDPVPVGVILMWSGDETDIPDGWFLCDGLNGTPDLRGRFIVGTNATYLAHATGGSATHSHTITIDSNGEHSHNITVDGHALVVTELPSHTHTNGVTDGGVNVFNHGSVAASPTTSDSIDNNSNDGIHEGVTSATGGNQPHSHGASSADDGSHTHGASSASTSSLPPYYALCFIMKGV